MSERRGPFPAGAVQHGGGVGSMRAFPTDAFPENLDPFVLCERFSIEPDTGFPTHPHRGFEIVSYMLEGGMAHEDSLGVSHTAREGEAMHITTGSGMEHSEMPAENEACTGLQLWVNLPREQKEADPEYEDASAEELPTEEAGDATVTTVVGDGSPLSLHVPTEYLDARVDGEWRWEVPAGWNGFLFGIEGAGEVAGEAFEQDDLFVVHGGDEGDEVTVSGSLRVAAVSAEPLGEPIQQRGPYVL